MIAVASLVNNLLILGIVIGLVFWVLDFFPVAQPIDKVVKIVTVVLAVLIVILLLLQFAGVPTANPLLA